MINRVTLVGHLGANPEIRRLETGALVAKFSLITSERYKDKSEVWKEQTERHNVTMWRSLAERAEVQLKEGSLVYIDGKLSHRSWQDPDGTKRYATDVVAAQFRDLGRKKGDTSSSPPGIEEELPSINKVTLVGRLGADPVIRRLETGALVAKFTVATNERYKDKAGEWKEQTEWHDIVMWRGLAERAEAQLKKGGLVYIDGKLSHRTWQDQDGNTRYVTEVMADYFRALSSKEDAAGEEHAHSADAQGAKSAAGAAQPAEEEGDGLPF